jgi:PAS domain-containing protein
MKFCNDKFFQLTGHPRVHHPKNVDWSRVVYPEDLHILEDGWKHFYEQKSLAQRQFRLMKTWNNSDGVQSQVWTQWQASPELDANGNVKTALGTLIDISQFKWAQQIQHERLEEQRVRMENALGSKRQQEK